MLKYRKDIDGLRAIAVLAVVAQHTGFGALQGGFVGVDVFFVISGYLISGMILSRVRDGSFSVINFYERRIRRIFPAFAAMLLAIIPLAYLYLLPEETIDFAKSFLTATFSLSNFYFWTQSGYFEAQASSKPLLHTWSLGVEEQFYIFFPLIVFYGLKYAPKRLPLIMWGLTGLSFAISAIGAFQFPQSSYYLLHTRAWELLLGALISMNAFPALKTAWQRNMAGIVGLAAIIAPIFAYSSGTPFPGAAALLPCGGTALIIAAGQREKTLIGRLLSVKPTEFIGLISYSIYLWHWPILVFHQNGFLPLGSLSAHATKIALVAISIFAGAVSWAFIETPFRKPAVTRKTIYRTFAAGCAILTVAGACLFSSNGLSFRYPASANHLASFLHYDANSPSRFGECFIGNEHRLSDYSIETCLRTDARPGQLLIGDSHAAHLWYGLNHSLPDYNTLQATASGCRPVLSHTLNDVPQCTKLMDFIYNDYLPKHRMDRILISGRWDESVLDRLKDTILYAKRYTKTVILFGPIVQYDTQLPRLLIAAEEKHAPDLPFEHRNQRDIDLNKEMRELAKETGVTYISLIDVMCSPKSCMTRTKNNDPLQFDYGHLTAEGSAELIQMLHAQGLL